MIEPSRCTEHSGMVKSIENLEGQVSTLSDKLHLVAERFEGLCGKLEPTLDKLDKLCDEQQAIHKDVQTIRAETSTVQSGLTTYCKEHKDTHKNLNWAVTVMGGTAVTGGLVFLAKMVGML